MRDVGEFRFTSAHHIEKLDPGYREPDPEALHESIGGTVIGALAAPHQLFDGHSARGTKRPPHRVTHTVRNTFTNRVRHVSMTRRLVDVGVAVDVGVGFGVGVVAGAGVGVSGGVVVDNTTPLVDNSGGGGGGGGGVRRRRRCRNNFGGLFEHSQHQSNWRQVRQTASKAEHRPPEYSHKSDDGKHFFVLCFVLSLMEGKEVTSCQSSNKISRDLNFAFTTKREYISN